MTLRLPCNFLWPALAAGSPGIACALALVVASGCIGSPAGGGGGFFVPAGDANHDGVGPPDGATPTDAHAAADAGATDATADAQADGQAAADVQGATDVAGPEALEDSAESPDLAEPDLAEPDLVELPPPDLSDAAPEVEPGPDAKPDTAPDAKPDAKPDAVPDAVADAKPDSGPDAKPDAAPDAKPDVPKDVAGDLPPEAVGDVATADTCGPGHDIASLLACTAGPVDFELKQVLVTYTFPAGWLLHDGSTTQGMMVYQGTTPWPFQKPVVGDVITLHVTKYGTYAGQQEILGADALTVTGKANAAATAVDLATVPKGAFGETLESRLLVGKGLVVKTISGSDGALLLPGAGEVAFRSDGATTLCTGAVFDLKGGALTQFGSLHRVHAMNGQGDLGAVDTSKCSGPAVYDMSNWGFEEPEATDPPPDFIKIGGGMAAVRTTDVKQAGAASAKLTWLADDNQDLVAGLFQPVLPGQKVTLTMWLLDQDPAGKARLGLTFYKADKTSVVMNQFATTYTLDAPLWTPATLAYTVPADAAFVRGFLRLYDEPAKWTGAATVHVDTWGLTVQ